ncbi:MAG: amidohydrolase family protein [Bacteroidia bacterium]
MTTSPLRAIHYQSLTPVLVSWQNGKFESIQAATSEEGLPVIYPGLTDLQVNGWKGTDLNRPGVTPEDFVRITREFLPLGITTWYPTLITQAVETLEATLQAFSDIHPQIAGATPGLHLEGPFISPEDGARGAHPRKYVRPPDWQLMEKWISLSENTIRLITLSPEWPQAPEFIKKCVASGIKVSIGHTRADTTQIRNAVEAGASLSTHLGNGSDQMLRRHPNYIWDQLAEDALSATIITDGFHLPDSVIKSILRVKGRQAMLVSDTTAIGGLPPGEYHAPIGGTVVLTPEGKLHMAENENMLAGSASNLFDCVRYLASTGMESLAAAWDRASVLPAGFMELPQAAGLAAGAPADFVLMEAGQIAGVWKAGVQVNDKNR